MPSPEINAANSLDRARRDGAKGVGLVATAVALAALLAAVALGIDAAQQKSEQRAIAVAMTSGNPDAASALVTQYGCGGCHTISGVPGADGKVGPALNDLRSRVYIAGHVRNAADKLVGFIVDPQRFSHGSAMPRTGITEAEARDVAAYLYAQ